VKKTNKNQKGEKTKMLVILSGVSGAGKDTIKKELIKRMEEVESLPSFTSRNPRVGEEEGIQYHFITKEQFEEKIKNNEFYEYDLHHENYYGTSRKLMNDKIQSGKIIVKDIEVNGTENLVKLLKEDTKIVTIFLKVDKDELRRRLENRGDNLTEEEMQIRLGRLEYEESKIKLYDYVIKNDDFEKTVEIIMTIIENEKRLENK
jgi:guanylate kinase